MGLSETNRATIVALEQEKAHRFLAQAERLRNQEDWEIAINRYYYACFHIVQALFVKNGLFAKTHSGMIRVFGENFIKTGKISDDNGEFISRLMDMRQKADYNCFYNVNKAQIDMCTKHAPLFVEAVEKLITASPSIASQSS